MGEVQIHRINFHEILGIISYLPSEKAVDKARLAFRLRAKMTKCVKMNFKNQYKGNLGCDRCESGEYETQEHMMECVGWEEERGSLDMYRIMDQVEFFSRVGKKKMM